MKSPNNIILVVIPKGTKYRLPDNPGSYEAYFEDLDSPLIFSKEQLRITCAVTDMYKRLCKLKTIGPIYGGRLLSANVNIESNISDNHQDALLVTIVKDGLSGNDYHVIEVCDVPTMKEFVRSYRYTMLSNGGYTEDVLLSTLTLYGIEQFTVA